MWFPEGLEDTPLWYNLVSSNKVEADEFGASQFG